MMLPLFITPWRDMLIDAADITLLLLIRYAATYAITYAIISSLILLPCCFDADFRWLRHAICCLSCFADYCPAYAAVVARHACRAYAMLRRFRCC